MSVGVTSTGMLRCPHCGYDLRSLPEQRCPECGKAFDPSQLAMRMRRRSLLVSGIIMAVVMHAPYAWLLFMDYPWNSYRWQWIRMWPSLPLLLVSSLSGVRRVLNKWVHADVDDPLGTLLLSALSLLLLYGLMRLGARGRWWLIITAAVLLVLSSANSYILHGLFLM